MERYNLPIGGIEVTASTTQDSGKLEIVNAIVTSTPTANRPRMAAPPIRAVQHQRRPLRYVVTRALVLLGAFAILGNIPVYSKILTPSDGDSTDDVIAALHSTETDQELSLPESIETYSGYEADALPSATSGEWSLHQVANGERLSDILTPLKLKTDVSSLTDTPEIKEALSQLRADASILIQAKDNTLKQLIYATGKRKAFIVSLHDGKYVGKWDTDLFEQQHSRIAFTVRNPFHYEANRAGLPTQVTRQLSKIFKNDVNFRRIGIGDQVSVIFEDFYYQSERIFTNNILAAEFNHRGDIFQRIRFTMADGKINYLQPDSDLELKRVAFDRTPVTSGRLSSGFGSRRHPILGYRRMHSGTDFAAPHGTPILATGSGVVSFVGRKGGYGKLIELRHEHGVATLYGHMSQYQKGLNQGSSVKRGDVIGYVGSTGSSTGNHVHYEFHINGEPQNPMTVALPETGILSPKEMKEFKNYAQSMSTQLIKLRETASIERNVRQQFGG